MDYMNLINNIAKNPNDPRAKALMGEIMNSLSTPKGKEILSALSQNGNSEYMKRAAEAAARGDVASAKKMADKILAGNKGGKIGEELAKIMKK